MNIFEFTEYRFFLEKHISSRPNMGRGERSALAEAANIKTSYMTQVLKGDSDLSSEQAFKVARYLSLNDEECEYFLLLVAFSRAGTDDLRTHYKKKIKSEQNASMRLKKPVPLPERMTEIQQIQYFSSLDNALVHLALTLPGIDSTQKIIEKLKMSPAKVQKILKLLTSFGLIHEDKKGRIKVLEENLHLPDNSSVIAVYHSQRRVLALSSLNNPGEFDLHYSSCVTISREDFLKIKQDLVDAVNKCRKIIKDSKAEVLCAIGMDFFEIK